MQAIVLEHTLVQKNNIIYHLWSLFSPKVFPAFFTETISSSNIPLGFFPIRWIPSLKLTLMRQSRKCWILSASSKGQLHLTWRWDSALSQKKMPKTNTASNITHNNPGCNKTRAILMQWKVTARNIRLHGKLVGEELMKFAQLSRATSQGLVNKGNPLGSF